MDADIQSESTAIVTNEQLQLDIQAAQRELQLDIQVLQRDLLAVNSNVSQLAQTVHLLSQTHQHNLETLYNYLVVRWGASLRRFRLLAGVLLICIVAGALCIFVRPLAFHIPSAARSEL